MTEQTPTDQEIDSLVKAEMQAYFDGEYMDHGTVKERLNDFSRAVLAKWGSPVVAGEVVATVIKRGASRDWMSERLGGLPDGVYSLYLAPQPMEREPLSDEKVDSLCKIGPVCATEGKVTRTTSQYRDELEAAQRYGLRKGERAHGITQKGGQ